LVGTGAYLTWQLRAIQFRLFFKAMRFTFFSRSVQAEGDISHLQALMTTLAATIGIGNIAGVATAVAIGGVGSIFWMWVTALVGMATKYAEAFLAIRYRETMPDGAMGGGPMYYIAKGANLPALAFAFALLGSIAAIGTGCLVQAHSVGEAMQSFAAVDPWVSGAVLCVLTAAVILGGIQSVGKVATFLVPFMALLYVAGGVTILAQHVDILPATLWHIVESGFCGQAAVGGFAGSSVMLAMRMGIARGVFCNEAGLGTGPIAAAAARTPHPACQGMVSMTGPFLDTLIVCSITGLVIAVSDVLGVSNSQGELLNGASLTMHAFAKHLSFGSHLVSFCAALFAYTTILGWSYYGEKCVEYMVGTRWILPYRLLFIVLLVPGSALSMTTVWAFADIANGLMALPNLIALLFLGKKIAQSTREYFAVESDIVEPRAAVD
jgi:AGCS family alanine or glycine:cation symporter